MRHIDIFTGIGGWPLGLYWAFGSSHKPIAFCELDTFCQKVLKKHWPDVPIEDNIFNMKGEHYAEERIDILTTSPPCQPYSSAGLRRGSEDDRAIWPAVIEFVRKLPQPPRWFCLENVRGFINIEDGLALEQTITDLENLGYEVQPFIIPACSVKAPHQRERVWIIANAEGARRWCLQGRGRKRQTERFEGTNSDASNTGNKGLQGSKWVSTHGEEQATHGSASERNQAWNEPWPEAATRLCSVDDGLPGGLVRSKGWRTNTLKAAGNAIVPQIAWLIGQAIKDADKEN